MHQKYIVRMWMTKCGKPSSHTEQRSRSGTYTMMCSTHSLGKVDDSPACSKACHQAILWGPSLMMVSLEPQAAERKHLQNDQSYIIIIYYNIYTYVYVYQICKTGCILFISTSSYRGLQRQWASKHTDIKRGSYQLSRTLVVQEGSATPTHYARLGGGICHTHYAKKQINQLCGGRRPMPHPQCHDYEYILTVMIIDYIHSYV